MAVIRVRRDKRHHVSIYLPAFLRDKFDLQNGDEVDVDTNGEQIIITPKKKGVGYNE